MDFLIHNTVCKHIHLVNILFKSDDDDFSHSANMKDQSQEWFQQDVSEVETQIEQDLSLQNDSVQENVSLTTDNNDENLSSLEYLSSHMNQSHSDISYAKNRAKAICKKIKLLYQTVQLWML